MAPAKRERLARARHSSPCAPAPGDMASCYHPTGMEPGAVHGRVPGRRFPGGAVTRAWPRIAAPRIAAGRDVGRASSWGTLHIERVDGCDATGPRHGSTHRPARALWRGVRPRVDASPGAACTLMARMAAPRDCCGRDVDSRGASQGLQPSAMTAIFVRASFRTLRGSAARSSSSRRLRARG